MFTNRVDRFWIPWARILLSTISSCISIADGKERQGYRTNDDPVAGGHGRSHEGKMLIAGAVECNCHERGSNHLSNQIVVMLRAVNDAMENHGQFVAEINTLLSKR